MWIYLVLVFNGGEPVAVSMPSMEKCREAVIHAIETAPHLEKATCSVQSTEWKRFIQ